MRWDRTTPQPPSIVLDTLEPAKEVNATILYSKDLVKKQYKVVDDEGNTVVDWTTYKSPVNIKNNNYVIYARGQDNAEVWSEETIYKVVNIDENQPVIKLTTDLVTQTQKLGIKVSVTDDIKVSKVKWAKGILGESFFASGGNEIANNSIVSITENAYYTFYAEDGVGNTQVYTLNVENIDLTPPLINISAAPENTVGTTSQITIDYGDSTTKEFKIGSSTTWMTYNDVFSINSYTILQNNWQNSDGTVTIFARGKDTAGNEIIVSKKIVNLDLDLPKAPEITSNAGYAVLTSYGVTVDATTTITYDSRTDIDNYYSIDNGATWSLYTGPFNMASGVLQAKSVKKTTGLQVVTNKTLGMPADAVGPLAYDGDSSTYATVPRIRQYIKVDSSMEGKKIRVKWQCESYDYVNMYFMDANKATLSYVSVRYPAVDATYTIPAGTKWIAYGPSYTTYVYEILPANEPTFSATNEYITINADPTKAIKSPYQMVTINYFPTSVQRLYRIGTTGEWLNYQDKSIWVNQGQTIYAKGVDQSGNETQIVSSYTANVADAVGPLAYDGNMSTYASVPKIRQYIKVDSSMEGKRIRVKWQCESYDYVNMYFMNADKVVISSVSTRYPAADVTYTIPVGTKWIAYGPSYTTYVYEIIPANEPTFSATNGYITLNSDLTKTIKSPYQMVSINYFPTSVQRLYRIGTTGEWLNYQDLPIWVNQDQTIYAKGIDQYGNETQVVSSYISYVIDAVGPLAYDGNSSTYATVPKIRQYIEVDSSMEGKQIRVKWQCETYDYVNMYFMNESKAVISTVSIRYPAADVTYTIPVGTRWIAYGPSYTTFVYEIVQLN
jgi:hypothetical protein